MLNLLFAFLIWVCVVYDVYDTQALLGHLGERIELASFTKKCVAKLGLKAGLVLGVGAPYILLSTVLLGLGWTSALAFVCGYRVNFLVLQILRRKQLGF